MLAFADLVRVVSPPVRECADGWRQRQLSCPFLILMIEVLLDVVAVAVTAGFWDVNEGTAAQPRSQKTTMRACPPGVS